MSSFWNYLWGGKPPGEVASLLIGMLAGLFVVVPATLALVRRLSSKRAKVKTTTGYEADIMPLDNSAADVKEAEKGAVVSLIGSGFEQKLRAIPRVAQLLADKGTKHAAEQTIGYLLSGFPKLTQQERRRQTYSDIRVACLQLVIESLQGCNLHFPWECYLSCRQAEQPVGRGPNLLLTDPGA